MRPPRGVWRSAFETRLPRICASRSGSARASSASSASTAIWTPAVSARASNRRRGVAERLGRGHARGVDRQLARVGDGERVEALDEAREPLGLEAGRADALGRGRERAALDQLERAEHGRDGRPQVVRHVGRHPLPERGRLGEPGAHRVEGVGERADLVVASDVNRPAQLAGGDPARGLGEPTQRADGPPREPHADTERDGEREAERDGERGRGRGDKARLGAGRGKVRERRGGVWGHERRADAAAVDADLASRCELARGEHVAGGVAVERADDAALGVGQPERDAPAELLGRREPAPRALRRTRPFPRRAPIGRPARRRCPRCRPAWGWPARGWAAGPAPRGSPATGRCGAQGRHVPGAAGGGLHGLHEGLERLLDHEPLEGPRRRDAHGDGDERGLEHAHGHERERPPGAERLPHDAPATRAAKRYPIPKTVST